MLQRWDYAEKVTPELDGGTYEVSVRLKKLKREDILESEIFEIGGCRWKVMLYRRFSAETPREMLASDLISCNEEAVLVDVDFAFVNRRNSSLSQRQRRMKTVHPLGRASIASMGYDCAKHPSEGFLSDGRLTVVIELRNISTVSLCDVQPLERDLRPINVEEICVATMCRHQRERAGFGIVAGRRRRMSVVTSSLNIKTFCEQIPGWRFWLCRRSPDGDILVDKCLDTFNDGNEFGDICQDHDDSEHPWVTLFAESKGGKETFPDITDDSIVIFCKRYQPDQDRLDCLGEIVVEKTKRFMQFADRLMDLAKLPSGTAGSFFEERRQSVVEITKMFSSIEQCGLHSGSVVVLVSRTEEEIISAEVLQAAIVAMQGRRISSQDDDNEVNETVQGVRDDSVCVVCMDAPRTVGFLHENFIHRCVCEDCAERVTRVIRPRCPVCRKRIENTIKVID